MWPSKYTGFGLIVLCTQLKGVLLTYYLYDHALFSLAVELCVVDLLPGAEVQAAFGDGKDGFVADEQRLQVRVAV